ncbi:GAF and ANTAR domain-containing protein [Micromonospora sp. NPDC049523]|uniref:GAF and ANTAR domain-containing protein n=1 Tax=Micromonospora sp. NPDC049523 TaxID=3155921 RepID=UPI00343ACFE1
MDPAARRPVGRGAAAAGIVLLVDPLMSLPTPAAPLNDPRKVRNAGVFPGTLLFAAPSRARCAGGPKVTGSTDRWVRALGLIAEQPWPDDGSPGVRQSLSRICRAAVHALSASGVGVNVLTRDGTQGYVVASDDAAYLLAELQFTLGEGPGVDAFHTRRPVLVTDLGAEDAMARWPLWVAAMAERRICAAYAFPLQVGAARLGVMVLFCEQAGPMPGDTLDQALTFAEIVMMTVLDGEGNPDQGAQALGFDDASGYRAEVAQAQGMIMVQLGVSIGDALIRLRAHAYAESRPLHQVARDVVDRKLRFDGS